MPDSQRLEVSTRVPARGQLHQLFRDQDARCGNVEEWDPRQLMSIAAHGPGCYVRADGSWSEPDCAMARSCCWPWLIAMALTAPGSPGRCCTR